MATTEMPMNPTPGYRALRYAALLYAFGTLVHTADHFRRGLDSVTSHVQAIGTPSTIAAFIVIALILIGHRTAPTAAQFGWVHGIGIAAVHLFPRWSAFSDAFTGAQVASDISGLSWVAVLLEIAGAFATGWAGLNVLRRERSAHATAR